MQVGFFFWPFTPELTLKVAAAAERWGYDMIGIADTPGNAMDPWVAATMVAAGIYQFTPLKRVCLAKCRTPLGFLLAEWREGSRGAWVMGLRHGLYCVGCCWVAMALLFVAGVMNLVWIALLALVVLAEKALPYGQEMGRVLGIAAVAWGAWLLAFA